MFAKSSFARQMVMNQQPFRVFSVMPKLNKVELTVRSPYRTVFENFSGFSRLYVKTLKGMMAIGNKSVPRVYLLPPGEMKVQGYHNAPGSMARAESGLFMHTGGWLFVHE